MTKEREPLLSSPSSGTNRAPRSLGPGGAPCPASITMAPTRPSYSLHCTACPCQQHGGGQSGTKLIPGHFSPPRHGHCRRRATLHPPAKEGMQVPQAQYQSPNARRCSAGTHAEQAHSTLPSAGCCRGCRHKRHHPCIPIPAGLQGNAPSPWSRGKATGRGCSRCITPALPLLRPFPPLTAPSELFQVHFHHKTLPGISSFPCLGPCLLAHQHLTNKEKPISGAILVSGASDTAGLCSQPRATARSRPGSRAEGRREIKKKNKSGSSSHNTQLHPPPTPAKGRQRADKGDNHLRQGESHQRSHHHDEIQDVPEVSEVGAVLQDQALIDHLQGRKH